MDEKQLNEFLQEMKARKQSHKKMESTLEGGVKHYWEGRKDEANFIIEKLSYITDGT